MDEVKRERTRGGEIFALVVHDSYRAISLIRRSIHCIRAGRGDRGAPIKLKPMALLSRIAARGGPGHVSSSGKSVAA